MRDWLTEALGIAADDRLLIRPQGFHKTEAATPEETVALRQELGIPSNAAVVLGAGYADLLKGFDLFLQVWRLLCTAREPIHFVWLGDIEPGLREWLAAEIDEASSSGSFHLASARHDAGAFYGIADVFALVAREDPFSAHAIEAMHAGTPVVAFDHSGGIPEFLKEAKVGYAIPYCDTQAMAAQLRTLLTNGVDQVERERTRAVCESRFAFTPYVRDLLHLALPRTASISVAVLNRDCARCLPERLSSIFDQSHPVEEIIIFDDASSDDSIEVIEAIADEHERDLTLVINDVSSGLVFEPWVKAAELSTAEFIWIAKADDLSEPSFLSGLVALMAADPSISMGFCDSKFLDEAALHTGYKPFLSIVEPDATSRSEVFDGYEFISRFLSIKNLIPNVSSVLWRRDALMRALAGCQTELDHYHVVGDWRIYLECLSAPGAKLAFVSEPLNIYRPHPGGVTNSMDARQHLDEISDIHRLIRKRWPLPPVALASQAQYLEEFSQQRLGAAVLANPLRDDRRQDKHSEAAL
jgi:hypothetical protein